MLAPRTGHFGMRRWMVQSGLPDDIERIPDSYMPDTVELFFHWLKGLSGKLPPAK